MFVCTKIHVRSFTQVFNYLTSFLSKTPVRFFTIKCNLKRNTGFILLISEKRYIDYTLQVLHKKRFLTNDKNFCLTKTYNK